MLQLAFAVLCLILAFGVFVATAAFIAWRLDKLERLIGEQED